MPDAVLDLVRLVRRRIAELADPVKAPQMQAYMKSSMPFQGVTAVPLRAALKQMYDAQPLVRRADYERAVWLLWDEAAFREERYAALALVQHRHHRAHQDPDALALLRHLVVTGAWWDYVDQLASRCVGPVLAAYPDEVTPVMRAWAVDDDLWVRRTAVLCQLQRKQDTDVSLLRDALEANLTDSVHGSEFFVRKAVGWALRQHARVDADWVRSFVHEHEAELSTLSRREALKHL